MITSLNIEPFTKWLKDQGVHFLPTTNPWEVLRFRARAITVVVYKNKDGLINYPDDEVAREILFAYDNKRSMDLRPFDGERSRIEILPQQPTLRDIFAGQAMQAMTLKDDGAYSQHDRSQYRPEKDAEWVAKAAYRYADAMLRAREAK